MRVGGVIFIISVLLGMFQSCGPMGDFVPAHTKNNTVTNPEFQPYINEFECYSGLSTRNVPISFADLSGNTAGVCHYFRVGAGPIRWGWIEIDEPYWKTISEQQRINLIFHELGHCVLGRDHVLSNSVTLCPTSFMHDSVIDTYCLMHNYDLYVKEMFPLWAK